MNEPQPLSLPKRRPPPGDAERFYPELLRDLADIVSQHAAEAGLDPARAAALGRSTADGVCELWQGQMVTIPKAAMYTVRTRWAQIEAEFTGRNHAELARRYAMGVKQIYRILKYMRAWRRERGGDLFDMPAEEQQR
jgi:Mor family transcriptional regulator